MPSPIFSHLTAFLCCANHPGFPHRSGFAQAPETQFVRYETRGSCILARPSL